MLYNFILSSQTMVGLMGAEFSKPLVANKVTHLICYKFEGALFIIKGFKSLLTLIISSTCSLLFLFLSGIVHFGICASLVLLDACWW